MHSIQGIIWAKLAIYSKYKPSRKVDKQENWSRTFIKDVGTTDTIQSVTSYKFLFEQTRSQGVKTDWVRWENDYQRNKINSKGGRDWKSPSGLVKLPGHCVKGANNNDNNIPPSQQGHINVIISENSLCLLLQFYKKGWNHDHQQAIMN